MDRALPFLASAVREDKPFLAVIWFHAPHLPVVGGKRHLAPYEGVQGRRRQHYYACITALDEQFGRLREKLRELGVADDTMLFFCSDNGPEGRNDRAPGSAGGLRGRKRSLFEGGVRVPAAFQWPARIAGNRTIKAPSCTSDYLPTVLDALGIEPELPVLDGISLLPLLTGKTKRRGRPIGFQSGKQAAWVTDRYKLVRNGDRVMLFDIPADPSEKNDLASEHPDLVKQMNAALEAWQAACTSGR